MATSRAGAEGGGYSLGVDLGTTYTAAAVWQDGRADVVPLGDRSPQIPSALFRTEDGEFLVGEPAMRRGASDPSRLATEFKRRIGDDTSLLLGGSPVSAHALMARLLSWVVAHVTAGQGAPPQLVVLTCPANWGPYRRELLEQAGRMAGLGSVMLCTEPSAAAVHFASTERVEVGDRLGVYDLGGGTFDAAALRKDGPTDFTLLGSPEGIEQLGGLDFDAAVLQHVWSSLGEVGADPEDEAVVSALSRLRRDCTEAKEALSVDTDVTVPVDLGGVHRKVRISRAELEDMIRPSLEETVAALERALEGARVDPADLAAVVLVGGSARIPLVTELLTRRLGRPVAVSAQPKHCVALGAAMVGARVAGPAAGPEPGSRVPAGPPADHTHRSSAAAPRPTAPASRPPAAERPHAGRRQGPVARHGLVAAGVLAVLAAAVAVVGPTVPPPDVLARLDADRRTATLDGPDLGTGSVLQLTLAGQHLPAGRATVSETRTVNLSGARVYTVGPLQADITGPDGAASAVTTQVRPAEGSPWPRLLSLPGAALVLGLLFAAAYAESLLRPLVRRRRRVTVRTVVGMGAVGALLGALLVLGVWMVGVRLLLPVSVAVVIGAAALSAAVLPLGLEGRLRPGSSAPSPGHG
jgi:molecular chaperone DnaK